MARSSDCELWANGRWQPISLDLALTMPRSRRMRCVECGGRVRPHGIGSTGQAAHFEHEDRHPGCPRGDCFDGTARPHHRPLR